MKQTLVSCLTLESSEPILVISLSTRNDTQVIRFDPLHGFPIFAGIPEYDTFSSHDAAINDISSKLKVETRTDGVGLIGIKYIGSYCDIIIITRVSDPVIFMANSVYTVLEASAITFTVDKTSPPSPNDLQSLKAFESFPINSSHFFCETFDFSKPLQYERNRAMISNSSLMSPFSALPIQNICTPLIQGSIFSLRAMPSSYYIIFRRLPDSGGEPSVSKGVNEAGVVGNDIEIEVVRQLTLDGGFETLSHFFRRSSTPLSILSNTSSELMEKSRQFTPIYLKKLAELYSVSSLLLFDACHTESKHIEHFYSPLLTEICSKSPQGIDCHAQCVDWDCSAKSDLETANNMVLGAVYPSIEAFGNTRAFWRRGKPTFESTQKGVVLFSCENGVDRSNATSFISALLLLCIFSAGDTKFSSPSTLSLKQSDPKIQKFAVNSFIDGGNVIAQLYLGSTTLQRAEVLSWDLHKIRVKSLKKSIQKVRENFAENAKAHQTAFSLFRSPPVPAIQCVSLSPYAAVINRNVDCSIFGDKPAFCQLSVDDPLVIALSAPSIIKMVAFQAFPASDKFTRPSTVSVYGGYYLNRMFPIMENLSLAISNAPYFLRFYPRGTGYYNSEIDVNQFQKVRYLSFTFGSLSPVFSVNNIYIFGCPVEDTRAIEARPNPEFFDGIFKNEWKRLAIQLPADQSLILSIDKKENPYFTSIDRLMTLQPREPAMQCKKCGSRKGAYFCSMCCNQFCNKCYAPSQVDGSLICLECSKRRYRFNESLALLWKFKAFIAAERYPFIREKYHCARDDAGFVHAQLVLLPPGKDAEYVLESGGPVWEPEPNYVPLTVLLRQTSKLKSISIMSNTNITVKIPGSTPKKLKVVPSQVDYAIEFTARRFELFIKGEKISIESIRFVGEPCEDSEVHAYPLPTPITSMRLAMCTPSYHKSKLMMQMSLQDSQVYGIAFTFLLGVSKIIVECCLKKSKTNIVLKTADCPNPIQLLFPSPQECDSVLLWFYPSGSDFSLPSAVPLNVSSANPEEANNRPDNNQRK